MWLFRSQPKVTATQLKDELERREDIVLLDVREPEEYEIARIEGSRLIPLQELRGRLDELNPSSDIVVLCHYGPRGSQAVAFLRKAGFRKVRNLEGGIDGWSQEVDPSIRRY